jgi:DNA-binding NtrC family response regulator
MIHILHVDDDPDHLDITRINLTRLTKDIEVNGVTSAEEALEVLEKQSFDCILSDYKLPEMSGLDLLKWVRRESQNVAFIFYTGQGNEELAIQALRSGADDYYAKNTSKMHFERLLNGIRKHYDQPAQAAT